MLGSAGPGPAGATCITTAPGRPASRGTGITLWVRS